MPTIRRLWQTATTASSCCQRSVLGAMATSEASTNASISTPVARSDHRNRTPFRKIVKDWSMPARASEDVRACGVAEGRRRPILNVCVKRLSVTAPRCLVSSRPGKSHRDVPRLLEVKYAALRDSWQNGQANCWIRQSRPWDRGREWRWPSPPSEPAVQFSRDGLSSQLFPHRGWRAKRWASNIVNSPRLAKKEFGHRT